MISVSINDELINLLSGENVHTQLSVPQLVEKSVSRGEATLSADGAVTARTGKYTGRSPKDKYIVEEASSKDKIDWGNVNRPISTDIFNSLYEKVIAHLGKKDELYVFKGFAGADTASRLAIQVVNEYAWQNLFVHQ